MVNVGYKTADLKKNKKNCMTPPSNNDLFEVEPWCQQDMMRATVMSLCHLTLQAVWSRW